MPKVFQRKRKPTKTDKKLNDIFKDLLSIDKGDINIKFNKCIEISSNLVTYKKLLTNLYDILYIYESEENSMSLVLYKIHLNNIDNYIINDYNDYVNKNDKINIYIQNSHTSDFMKKILEFNKTLLEFRKKLTKEEITLTLGSFIHSEPGIEMSLIPFSNINFKMLWTFAKDNHKKLILLFLKKILKVTDDIFRIINLPNINVSNFSEIIKKKLLQMKKKLTNCNDACDLLISSLYVLEDNFNSYYLDAIEASNPNLILERFITDISESKNINIDVTIQFGRIISFIKQNSKIKTDSRLNYLVNMLDENYSKLKK